MWKIVCTSECPKYYWVNTSPEQYSIWIFALQKRFPKLEPSQNMQRRSMILSLCSNTAILRKRHTHTPKAYQQASASSKGLARWGRQSPGSLGQIVFPSLGLCSTYHKRNWSQLHRIVAVHSKWSLARVTVHFMVQQKKGNTGDVVNAKSYATLPVPRSPSNTVTTRRVVTDVLSQLMQLKAPHP